MNGSQGLRIANWWGTLGGWTSKSLFVQDKSFTVTSFVRMLHRIGSVIERTSRVEGVGGDKSIKQRRAMTKMRAIVESCYHQLGYPAEFDREAPVKLRELFESLPGELGTEIREYWESCVPVQSHGNFPRLLNCDQILDENLESAPLCYCRQHGFIAIALEAGCGSPFCYCTVDHCVYHLYSGQGEDDFLSLTREHPVAGRGSRWNSLAEFFEWIPRAASGLE